MNRKLKSSLSMFLSAAIAASSINVVASAETDSNVQATDVISIAKAADISESPVIKLATKNSAPVAPEVYTAPIEKLDIPAEGVGPFTSGSTSVSISGDGVLTVSGTGDMGDFEAPLASDWAPYLEGVTEIVIEDTVTSVGNYAFHGFTSVKKVTLGSGVLEVGAYAFYGCTALATLTNNAENITTYGERCFYNCEPLSSITFADTVTSIGAYAFNGCKKLTQLTIPASVGANLGQYAFYGCSTLKTVIIEDGVTTIPAGAFCDCIVLEKVKIPTTGLTLIGGEAFSGCAALATINNNSDCFEVPTCVKQIGESAFANCASIKSLLISGGVTFIGNKAFMSCSELKDVNISGSQSTTIGEEAFASCGKLTGVTLNNGNVTKIDTKAFYQSGLQNIALSDSLTTINDSAFAETHLKAVKIPVSVTTIGNSAFSTIVELASLELETENRTSSLSLGTNAFAGCTGLKTINTLEGVNNFGKWCFLDCTSLTTVTLPSTTTKMGDSVFDSCTSLTTFNIEDGATYIGKYVINNCPVKSVTIPSSVKTNASAFEKQTSLESTVVNCNNLQANMFLGCSKLKSVTLNNTLTILNKAFSGCTSLEKIALPASITSMGTYVFSECTALTSIALPVSLTTVPAGTCSGCTSLESASYGNVTAINKEAFSGCVSLKSAYIPDTTNTIGESAFSGCVLITSATMNGATSVQTKAFLGCTALSSVKLGDDLTTLGSSAFENCISLPSINIPDGVTILNNSVFAGCTALKTVSGAPDLTKIGSSTFENCALLTGYTIPSTVAEIGANAFMGCSCFDSDIPDITKTIGAGAFMNCTSLGKSVKVTLPNNENFKTISNDTFNGCTSLHYLAIPTTVTTIGQRAFMGCNASSFNIMAIPKSVTKIDGSAFEGCTNLTNFTIDSDTEYDGTGKIINGRAFANCSKLKSITLPTELGTIDASAFLNCISLQNITIPPAVNKLGTNVFEGCTSLTKATFSGTAIKTLPNSMFQGCTSLKAIVMPATITSIGSKAFMGCSSLEEVTIPGTVTTIQNQAFDSCTALKFIVLPVSLTPTGTSVFANCTSLETVIYLSMRSPSNTSKYFDNCKKLTLYCYEDSAIVNGYAKAANIPVKYLEGQNGSYVVIIKQPEGVSGVKIGDTAEFSVKVASEGTIKYEWFYKNPGDEKFTLAKDFTGSSYSVTVTKETDGQQIYCVVTSTSATDESVTNMVTSDMAFVSTITAPEVSLAGKAPQQISIKWDAVESATGYEVYRVDTLADEISDPIAKLNKDTLVYNDTSVVIGSTYYYYVVAVNSELNVHSEFSDALEVTVPSTIDTVKTINATGQNGKVALTWEPVIGAEKYAVYVSTNHTTYKLLSAAVTGTSYTATGLTNGTQYSFKMKAYGSGTWSGFSEAVYATPTSALLTPTGLTTTADDSKVTIKWNEVDGATQYAVYYSTNHSTYSLLNSNVTTTSFTATGLKNGTEYSFKVKAYGSGKWTGFSEAVYATPIAAFGTPTDLTATAGDGKVTVSWGAVNDATQYAIYYSTDHSTYKLLNSKVTSNSYIVTGLTNGTKYSFKVKAYGNGKWTGFSEAVYATPAGSVTTPTNLKATAGNGKVTVSWGAVSGATQYAIYYSTDHSTYKLLNSKVTSASYTATGLTNGTKYSFKVKAYGSGKWTGFSEAVYATPAGAVTTPTNLKATAGNSQVTVSWGAVSGATQYAIYYSTDHSTYKLLNSKVTSTSYTATGLTNGTKYSFKVKAYGSGVWTGFSEAVYATPAGAVTTPTNLKVTVADGKVTLSWDAVSGATQYAVYISTDHSTYRLITGAATGTSYTISDLINGTEYSFKVKAYGSGVWTGFSDPIFATPEA